MSYLDVPRIHFMGLFYAAPGNLNNVVDNFNLNNPLDFNTGRYKYPDGTSQIWLERCVVTSVIGLDGELCSDPKRDALVGARVTSPAPDEPKRTPGGGVYTLAKLVDLDPNMQFRSEVYGLRIYVDFEGGGFSGELALPPQLRDLWFGRGNGGINGLQVAVGTWHQRLTSLTWTPPKAHSPVFDALRARSGSGLDVKLGVDMFQTARANQFTEGDRFGFGRLVAAIGPASAGEPAQIVPGRRLYTPRTFDNAPAAESRMMAKAEFTRQAAEVAMSEANAVADWNRTDFRVSTLQDGRTLLIADLFNSAPLATGQKGKLETGGKVVVGFLEGDRFTPLAKGEVSLAGYTGLDSQTRKLKDVWWPDNAAIAQIALDAAESRRISHTPIAIQVDGTTVLRENPNGVYLNVERASTRLEPKSGDTFDVFAFEYGRPSPKLPAGLKLTAAVYNDETGAADPTTIFSFKLNSGATGPGHFRLSVNTGPAVPLTDLRKPLDSFLCFLTAAGDKYLVGEAMTLKPQTGPPTPPFLSFIFWQNHQVVDQPTWEKNIKPLMDSYARLFPGMVSILDISNLGTIKSRISSLQTRFRLDRNDPGFMPVSRDMSPATVRMMLRFLDSLAKEKP